MDHLPALDGLRGIAVAAVIAYHLDFGWAKGGYLGVSLFFTLSGYLISRLMVAEVEATGGVDTPAFWRRRIKRLAPASLVTLTAIAVLEHLDPTIWSTNGFRGSMLGALFNVANWQSLISGAGYFDLLGVASPVRHYWSLAIEEQFYLVFPLVVLVLIGRQRKRIDRLIPVAAAGIAVSVVMTLLLSADPERVYLGTDTRMAEILFGVLFGALHQRFGAAWEVGCEPVAACVDHLCRRGRHPAAGEPVGVPRDPDRRRCGVGRADRGGGARRTEGPHRAGRHPCR